MIGAVHTTRNSVAQEPFQRTANASALPDDGWRYTKMGWQKNSSWKVAPASRHVRFHPAALAVWMLVMSVLALRSFPFQGKAGEEEHAQGTSWFPFLTRVIPGDRTVKVNAVSGRSLF